VNIKDKNSYEDKMLKDAYEQVTPADSWGGLRARIGNRIAESQVNSIQRRDHNSVRFWKNLSFAMAASFIVTAGILVYTIGLNKGTNLSHKQPVASRGGMLVGQEEMDKLVDAFSQVHQLFGDQSRWIVIGSDNNSQVGIMENVQPSTDSQELVVVRLAISGDGQGSQRRYYDVVTYADQKTNLQLPLANATALMIDLKPIIQKDGTICVEIDATANGMSQSKSRCAIASESFTPLVNMRVNGDWIRIDGVGRMSSADGKTML
jgi:hypothetical protein